MGEDYKGLFEFHMELAAEGNLPDSQELIGELYLRGLGVEQSDEKAFEWFQKAAEQGDVNAQHNLSEMYWNGRAVPQNYRLAAMWALKAAEQGFVMAQTNLAKLYLNGWGLPQDNEKGLYWMREAAEQGDDMAKKFVASMVMAASEEEGSEFGYFSGANINDLHRSAKSGHSAAQLALGSKYAEDGDDEQAVYWLTKAAEQDNYAAASLLGSIYYDSTTIQDYEKASFWLHKASDNGEDSAQFQLGWMYLYGEGVTQNDTEALYWIRKSSEQGNKNAEYLMRESHYNGDYASHIVILDKAKEKVMSIMEDNMKLRNEVFICYKHDDKDIADELKEILKILGRNNSGIEFWYDGMLEMGQDWKENIKLHLQKAKVAILLVSNSFLASDFIYDEELPEILRAAKTEGPYVIWIPVTHALVNETPIVSKERGINIYISDFQAACDPKKPLREMSLNERQAVYNNIAKQIKKVYGQVT